MSGDNGTEANVFDSLTHAIENGPIAYLVILVASGGDVVFPPVPSETIVVTAGVFAAKGDLFLGFVIPLAALGAFIGDNIAYWLGRGVGDPIADKLFRGEKGRRRLEWAERAIGKHGRTLIILGRFIPGGRTASTFSAGTLEMDYRRFVGADLIAVALWATFATMLGFAGGSTFKNSHWKPLAASLAVATLIALATEVYRRIQKRRGKDILGDPLQT